MKLHLLSLIALTYLSRAFAETSPPAWSHSFVANLPPYDHSWQTTVTKAALQASAAVDLRVSAPPISIKDAIRLADEKLATSEFPFAKELKLESFSLTITAPDGPAHVFYVIAYRGHDGDGYSVYIPVVVLMSGVVILPEDEKKPNKPLHGTPAKAPSSSTEPESRRP